MGKPWYSTKRATTVTRNGDTLVCTYHNTPVVKWDDDWITLNSGGYQTATTKVRMNEVAREYALGYRVFQHDFEWFVSFPNKQVIPFTDNMRIQRV